MFALEVFPFDEATRRTPEFKSVFIVVSAVWGTFFLGFAAIQAAVLLTVGVDAYIALRIVDAAAQSLVREAPDAALGDAHAAGDDR